MLIEVIMHENLLYFVERQSHNHIAVVFFREWRQFLHYLETHLRCQTFQITDQHLRHLKVEELVIKFLQPLCHRQINAQISQEKPIATQTLLFVGYLSLIDKQAAVLEDNQILSELLFVALF